MTDVAATSAAISPTPPTAWKSPAGFGFRDLLDIVNPLQHIPIVSSVYRWLTGDRPGEAAQMAGDALYGGPIGVGFGLIGAAMEDKSGHDLGERALIAMFGPKDSGTAVASAQPAPANPGAPATAASDASASSASPATAVAALQRAPIPLYGGIAQPVPAQTAVAQANPASAFEAHQAALERSITAGRPGPAAAAPVPLVLPAGTLVGRTPAPAQPASPNPAQPTEISQKMMDALDKYMQMEKGGKDAAPSGSGSVDLAL